MAATRLHECLMSIGLESVLYVKNKHGHLDKVLTVASNIRKLLLMGKSLMERLRMQSKVNPARHKSFSTTNSIGLSGLHQVVQKENPDIIHLHWINDGFLSPREIGALKKPVVWSLHDMWPFTGGCHYNDHCDQYLQGCGECPMLKVPGKRDISRLEHKRKHHYFTEIQFIGLSRWLADLAKNSKMVDPSQVKNLPNPIDVNRYKPLTSSSAIREMYGIRNDQQCIAFGAVGATSDPRKGFDKLLGALKQLELENFVLLVFGAGDSESLQEVPGRAVFVGEIADEITMCMLYNTADVVVVPSLQENLSNTIMESLACGTPVVSFDIGGNGDMIDHCSNGYLAKPFDERDLGNGIEWILHQNKEGELGKNARNKVIENFSNQAVGPRYRSHYDKIIENFKP